jgi:hypothetical protein
MRASMVVGRVLGNYRVLRKLGQGGMGAVYLGEHVRIARRAAIKVLLPELAGSAPVVQRFLAEARAASLIKHPGIVEVLDCDVHQGQPYIVMELLEGESLAAYLSRQGRLDAATAVELARQIAGAAQAAHRMNIVHRDLKPDNIFLTGGSALRIKIVDFGVAKLDPGDQLGASVTRSGMLLGTPTYMSPEQCRGAGRVDHLSDVYSLGCILFEMLCGRPPFEGQGAGDLIVAHVSHPAPSPRRWATEISAELEGLVLGLLAKAPGERPPSMTAVEAALAALPGANRGRATMVLDAPAPAGPPTLPLNESVPFPQATTLGSLAAQVPARPRRKVGPALAVAAALVVAGVTVSLLRASPAPEAPPSTASAEPPSAPTETPVAAPRSAKIEIDVASPPAGLAVAVDGAPGELPLRLPRGEEVHRLHFTAPGRQPVELVVASREDQTLTLAMPPLEARPVRRPASPRPEARRELDLDALAEPSFHHKPRP